MESIDLILDLVRDARGNADITDLNTIAAGVGFLMHKALLAVPLVITANLLAETSISSTQNQ